MTDVLTNSDLRVVPADPAKRRVLLHARDLRKSFGIQHVLNGVSLSIYEGEVILLRGANGSGKTTLLNILTGNLEPDSGEIVTYTSTHTERFKFPTRWWNRLNAFSHFSPERMSLIGINRTWQEVRLFDYLDLRDNLSVAARGQAGENPLWSLFRRPTVSRRERQVRAASEAALREIGLGGRLDSLAGRISLGQSKRVSVMRALQSNPKIIFLDEPLAGLDAAGVDEVVGLLERLNRERGFTLIITEHASNIHHIAGFATASLTLGGGKVIPAEIEEARLRSNEQRTAGLNKTILPVASKQRSTDVDLPGGARLTLSAVLAPGPVALEVKDLVVYRNKRLVVGSREGEGSIKGVSFKLLEGQRATLEAPNGWGKTTLLEAIAGLLPANSGSIRMFGQPVGHLPSWRRSSLGTYLLRAGNNYFSSLTVQETLRLSGVTEPPTRIRPILGKRMAQLSGGERQAVALACTYGASSRRLLLLDEPFSALDEINSEELTHTIKKSSGVTTLIAIPSLSLTRIRADAGGRSSSQ
jgi:ABC-type branched-subunit amino acid transport system ATPase component